MRSRAHRHMAHPTGTPTATSAAAATTPPCHAGFDSHDPPPAAGTGGGVHRGGERPAGLPLHTHVDEVVALALAVVFAAAGSDTLRLHRAFHVQLAIWRCGEGWFGVGMGGGERGDGKAAGGPVTTRHAASKGPSRDPGVL